MKNFGLFTICILLLSTVSVFSVDQNITASAKADKTQITIGDPLNLTVTLACPTGYKPAIPEKQEEIGPWEVKDIKISQETKDRLITNLSYTLAVFTTGQIPVPEMTFSFYDAANSTVTATTQTIPITVESVLGLVKGAPALRDIKPPLSLRIPAGVYLIIFIIIAGIATGAWFWYQNYRKTLPQLPAGPVVPAIPPYQAAMDELEKLKNSSLVSEGKIKEFYIALTDIIRKYLGAVYSIDTLDKTTGEIYQLLRAAEPDKKALVFIKDFFQVCDLVKFAKYMPEEKAAWEGFAKAERIIED